MNEETKVSNKALRSFLALYDGIGEAERQCLNCQSSLFRSRVTVLQEAAMDAAGEVSAALEAEKAPGGKKAAGLVSVPRETLKLLMGVMEALDQADSVYQCDQDGCRMYRSFVKSVYQAPNNRRVMEALRTLAE